MDSSSCGAIRPGPYDLNFLYAFWLPKWCVRLFFYCPLFVFTPCLVCLWSNIFRRVCLWRSRCSSSISVLFVQFAIGPRTVCCVYIYILLSMILIYTSCVAICPVLRRVPFDHHVSLTNHCTLYNTRKCCYHCTGIVFRRVPSSSSDRTRGF